VRNNVLPSSNFRYNRITLLAVLAVMVLTLMFSALPDINLFWRELQNTGHTLFFIPVVILVLMLLRDTTIFFGCRPIKLYMAACTISLLVGTAIELIQLIIDRDANPMDIMRDLAGILTGLGLYASTDPELQKHPLMPEKWLRAIIVTLSFGVFSASMLPLALLSTAYAQRQAAFPLVVDLTASWMRPFLQLKNAVIHEPDSGEISIDEKNRLTRIDLKKGSYPGLSVIEPFPDWSAYKTLTIIAYSKLVQPIDLTLRIHDEHHNYAYTDRFNIQITLTEGTNYFQIPLEDIKRAPVNRQMNMARIKNITFFSANPAEGMYFYVGQMRLE